MEKKDLLKMEVSELKEEALKHPDQIKGVEEMEKEQLIASLMGALGIEDTPEEPKPVEEKPKPVEEEPKSTEEKPKPAEEKPKPAEKPKDKMPPGPRLELKKKIRLLKAERAKAEADGNQQTSEILRKRLKSLRRLLGKTA